VKKWRGSKAAGTPVVRALGDKEVDWERAVTREEKEVRLRRPQPPQPCSPKKDRRKKGELGGGGGVDVGDSFLRGRRRQTTQGTQGGGGQKEVVFRERGGCAGGSSMGEKGRNFSLGKAGS